MNHVSTHVFDAGEANFTTDVVEASQAVPVLVDFWAEWCEPCRQLGPLLESLALRSGGGFKVAKVDTEKEQRLAAAFQVQSIPFVVAFKDGKPADAFVGVKSEPELIDFLARLGVSLDAAKEEEAEPQEESSYEKALVALRRGDLVAFEALIPDLESLEEDEDDYSQAARILAALDWIQDRIPSGEPAAQELCDARRTWLEGNWEKSLHELLASVSENRDYAEQMARRALVLLMQCHGEDKELLAQVRRRLALLLY
jgi:putative thioredoxin